MATSASIRGAELLFQVLTEREERHRSAVASNHPFSEWGETFTDPRLAAAVVDRLTFKAHIIDIGTDSYRLRNIPSQHGPPTPARTNHDHRDRGPHPSSTTTPTPSSMTPSAELAHRRGLWMNDPNIIHLLASLIAKPSAASLTVTVARDSEAGRHRSVPRHQPDRSSARFDPLRRLLDSRWSFDLDSSVLSGCLAAKYGVIGNFGCAWRVSPM